MKYLVSLLVLIGLTLHVASDARAQTPGEAQACRGPFEVSIGRLGERGR